MAFEAVGTMKGHVQSGQRLPDVRLAALESGELRSRPLSDYFAGKRAIIIGIPGAFTPICSKVHIPGFVELAPGIKLAGFDVVACIAPNDPWTLDAWAQTLDPSRKLLFLSDGNLEFARASGLHALNPDLFIGERMQRFSLTAKNCIVEKISVEKSILNVTCSSAEACLGETYKDVA